MKCKRGIVSVILAGLCLLAAAYSQTPSLKDSIAQYEQKAAKARSDQNQRELILSLNLLAIFYRQAGQLQKALGCLNEALPIEQQTNSVLGEAMTYNTMGRVYTDLGQEEKALSYLNLALSLWRTIGQRTGEAGALTYIGWADNNLGRHEEALKNLNEAMEIWRDIDNPDAALAAQAGAQNQPSGRIARRIEAAKEKFAAGAFIANSNAVGEATTLDALGRTYSDAGQGFEAIKYFDQSLTLFQKGGERAGQALAINDMGPAYAETGQKQKAFASYNQALAIWREIGSRQGEALTLNFIGRLYRDLGQQQSAMDYYKQALPIWREVGNRNGEGLALSDIGRAYADLGQPGEALDYANQALPIFLETSSRRGEAMALNNMGRDEFELGKAAEAMNLELQALALWRESKDQRNEALDLMTISWSYSALQQPESSLASALAALYLAKAVGDSELEGGIEMTLMMGYRKQRHLEEAVFFGYEAVNSYQKIRKNITGLDKSLQAGFAQSKSRAYRTLAELLVEAGRLGEAEKILDLLKEQELKDLVPGAAPGAAAAMEPFKLSPAQQKVESLLPELENKAHEIEEWDLQSTQLKANPERTADDNELLKSLDAKLRQTIAAIRDSFEHVIFPTLDRQTQIDPDASDATQSFLQDSLARLGKNVMGVRILLGEEHAYAIAVTANSRSKYVLPASSADLRSKAFEALKAIGSPSSDPRPQLHQLYAMIVAPLEEKLKNMEAAGGVQGDAPTLLWSLDDALRYAPMSALYDGDHYLVERFHNVLFTPESYRHITDAPIQSADPPKALAMGLSKSYAGMPALPGVIPELDSVVHDPSIPGSHGPMQGKILPDEQFTLAALKTELGSSGEFPVVHIASHFVLIAGAGDEPFLLMGGDKAGDANGFEWSLADMENSPIAFHGTRLLTLSACSTAKDYKSRNGFEMDSMGMVAQQKDAQAVLATLWDVNDLGASRIMSDFYDRWIKNPAKGKAEALRQAQLAFLHGAPSASGASTGRGFESVEQSPAQASNLGYAHPYYWAPFVLIGNYQ